MPPPAHRVEGHRRPTPVRAGPAGAGSSGREIIRQILEQVRHLACLAQHRHQPERLRSTRLQQGHPQLRQGPRTPPQIASLILEGLEDRSGRTVGARRVEVLLDQRLIQTPPAHRVHLGPAQRMRAVPGAQIGQSVGRPLCEPLLTALVRTLVDDPVRVGRPTGNRVQGRPRLRGQRLSRRPQLHGELPGLPHTPRTQRAARATPRHDRSQPLPDHPCLSPQPSPALTTQGRFSREPPTGPLARTPASSRTLVKEAR